MFNKTAFKFITSFVGILVASFTVFAALGYYENSTPSQGLQNQNIALTK